MKRIGFRVLAVAGTAVLAAGCARMGLNPLPDDVETGGMEHGLDAFPEPMHKGETAKVGLDPFPHPVHEGGSSDTGLTPFPATASKKDEDGKFGVNPFPEPMHPKGTANVGLDPFPNSAKKGEPAAVASKGSSKSVTDEVPPSEEYPDSPPVVLPPSPDRSGQSGEVVKKKKRPAWKDE